MAVFDDFDTTTGATVAAKPQVAPTAKTAPIKSSGVFGSFDTATGNPIASNPAKVAKAVANIPLAKATSPSFPTIPVSKENGKGFLDYYHQYEGLTAKFGADLASGIGSLVAVPRTLATYETKLTKAVDKAVTGGSETRDAFYQSVIDDLGKGKVDPNQWDTKIKNKIDETFSNVQKGYNVDPNNPTFPQQVAGGFGSMLSFYVPSSALGKVFAVAGDTEKLAEGANILKKIFNTGNVGERVSNASLSALESLQEGDQTFQETYKRTGDVRQAQTDADRVTGANMALLGITNKFAKYFEGVKPGVVNAIKGVLTSSISEGSQEGLQQMIQNITQGKPLFEGVKDSALIGGIVGGGTHIATRPMTTEDKQDTQAIKQAIIDENKDNPIVKEVVAHEDTRQKVTDTIKEALQTSTPDELAQHIVDTTSVPYETAYKLVLDAQSENATPSPDDLLSGIKDQVQAQKVQVNVAPGPITPSQETKTKEKTNSNQTLEEEATKYNSAEEFVKAQGTPVYHGSDAADIIEKEGFKKMPIKTGVSAFGEGSYLTTNKANAKGYGGVVSAYLPKDIKLKKVSDSDAYQVDTQKLIKEGYDGVELATGNGRNITIFDHSKIKTKTQLTDIYNQSIKSKELDKGIADLYTKAPDAKKYVDDIASEIAKEHGATLKTAPLKSVARSKEKAIKDYNGDHTQLSDIARNTIISSHENLSKIVEDFKPHAVSSKHIKPGDDSFGYTGVNIKVKTPNGMLAEVQANTPDMIFAKEEASIAKKALGEKVYQEMVDKHGDTGGKGHEIYKKARDLDPELQKKEYQALAKESREYYSQFYDASKSETKNETKSLPKGVKESTAYKKAKDRMAEEFQEDVTYTPLKISDQMAKAFELYEQDPERAQAIALGLEEPPVDVTDTAISLVVAEKAKEEGNYKVQADTEKARSLRQTRRGQEIVMERGRVNENSPEYFIGQLLARRKELAAKKYKPLFAKAKNFTEVLVEKTKEAKKKAGKRLKTELEIKAEELDSFLDSITC